MRVGVAFHEKYRQYDFGPGHPFRGDRFGNALEFFEEQGLLTLPYVDILEPEIAKLEDLLRVHKKSYIDLIFDFAEKGRPYDLDTPLSPSVLEAALYIMGGGLRIGKALSKGEVTRGISLGGGLHHAGESFGGGFCIFNDVAILARYLQDRRGLRRVLILDYDVHAGNGTSDIFYTDPNVLFISIHQDPKTLFPGSGFVDQIGRGEGKGLNVNLPLPPGTGNTTYLSALREIFVPLAKEFKPDVILANGGSDPHFADILGSLSLTVDAFFDLSTVIAEVAKSVCGGRLVLLIGSGYNPKVLPRCWYALAAGAADLESIGVADNAEPPVEPPWCSERVKATMRELKGFLKDHWKCFT
ncbi:MAG: histone deacetylase [Candidatus Bathyarchaeota archaeon]|nr:histone deacetylase [Candidatus Bathyarchaeota archaeon]